MENINERAEKGLTMVREHDNRYEDKEDMQVDLDCSDMNDLCEIAKKDLWRALSAAFGLGVVSGVLLERDKVR